MQRRKTRLTLMLGTLVFLTGCLTACVMGPDYEENQLELPSGWGDNYPALSNDEYQNWHIWWQQFNDPQLNALVEQALSENLELTAQLERIVQARAELGLADAERFPTVALQADASRERLPGTAIPIDNDFIRDLITSTNNQFSVAAALNYEVDLWGRVAREREAADAMFRGSVYAHEAARMNVITEVITTYVELKAAQHQYQLAHAMVAAYEESYQLQRLRFELGETSELETSQAHSELAAARTELPQNRQRVSALQSALAILLGMTPTELLAKHALDFTQTQFEDLQLPQALPATLPADILTRRPDIRAAQASAMAATAQIGVAEASRFPSLSLQGFFGTAAADHSDLFSSASRSWGISGAMSAPIFDFGRTGLAVERAQVQRRLAEIEYEAAVNMAFVEVRDALVGYDNIQQLADLVKQQALSIERTAELVDISYEEGLVSFIEVLDARRARYQARQAQTEAHREQLIATVTLFKALGGGWSNQYRVEVKEDTEKTGSM